MCDLASGKKAGPCLLLFALSFVQCNRKLKQEEVKANENWLRLKCLLQKILPYTA